MKNLFPTTLVSNICLTAFALCLLLLTNSAYGVNPKDFVEIDSEGISELIIGAARKRTWPSVPSRPWRWRVEAEIGASRAHSPDS